VLTISALQMAGSNLPGLILLTLVGSMSSTTYVMITIRSCKPVCICPVAYVVRLRLQEFSLIFGIWDETPSPKIPATGLRQCHGERCVATTRRNNVGRGTTPWKLQRAVKTSSHYKGFVTRLSEEAIIKNKWQVQLPTAKKQIPQTYSTHCSTFMFLCQQILIKTLLRYSHQAPINLGPVTQKLYSPDISSQEKQSLFKPSNNI
jgi:hypothetical protein